MCTRKKFFRGNERCQRRPQTDRRLCEIRGKQVHSQMAHKGGKGMGEYVLRHIIDSEEVNNLHLLRLF